jgi:hypothetical protein
MIGHHCVLRLVYVKHFAHLHYVVNITIHHRIILLKVCYSNRNRNFYLDYLAERRTLKRASSASKRPPLFQSKELLSKICTHIKDSLLITTELVLLELDGLPFRRKDLTILAQVKPILI